MISLSKIARNSEGYLINYLDWNQEIAILLANEEKIKLTCDHWEIINALRDFYIKYQTTPSMRALIKIIAGKLGAEKSNSIYIHKLFPGETTKKANKIAGLPKPVRCI